MPVGQEAVTNAVKHAPGAPIDITIQGNVGTVSVDVVNGPPDGALTARRSRRWSWLAGMRERAARCGGTFHAGPTAAGGWRVTAALPRRPAVTTVPTDASPVRLSAHVGEA